MEMMYRWFRAFWLLYTSDTGQMSDPMRTVQYYDSHLRSEAQIKYHLIRELCELMQKK